MTAQHRFRAETDPIAFGTTFVRSEAFKNLFREGMTLVEETAAYLDGPGRAESRLLSRQAALAYASESMRLTTRLMQIASWLLVQRAVREGDMGVQEASQDRYRVKPDSREPADEGVELPAGLLDRGGRVSRFAAKYGGFLKS